MSTDLQRVVELVSLVYHEARNVRHVTGTLELRDPSRYAKFVSLPRNRADAWNQMGRLRDLAVQTGTIAGTVAIFTKHFGLGLDELVALYELPVWRHSPLGGNRWAGITEKVGELVRATDAGDPDRARTLHREVLSMRHNTGTVAEKLRGLTS